MAEVKDIRQIIEAGGSIEGDKGSEGTKNLYVYTTDTGKKTLYSNESQLPKTNASIKLDTATGKISVTIPDKWKDDEEVKKYVDNYMLKTLSGNYKANKDTQYQDPFDETKQIKTEEYINKLNEGLQYRVNALNATAPTKAKLISRYGGTDEKNKVINNMSTEDIVKMSLNYAKDDSWIPIPKYMLLAYPQIEKLETYNNGFAQKKDFLENFYNIEGGKITEKEAYGIATTPEKMLSEIEDMTPEEIAMTVGFGEFIGGVDPKRSNWQQFLQAGDALSRGFYGGLYDWGVESVDLVANIANFSFINGNTVETRDFLNGLAAFGDGEFDATKYAMDTIQQAAYTNKDALSKAQIGYVQGRLAGQAVDTVVTLIAVGEGTKALSKAATDKIIEKGSTNLAEQMAKEVGATAGGTKALPKRAMLSGMEDLYGSLKNVSSGGATYRAFFSQTFSEAFNLYSKAVGSTTAMLQSMSAAQISEIVNSAAKIATAANYANTAVNVLGSLVLSSVVSNKELTTKVLSGEATSSEAKEWIQQTVWDAAKMQSLAYLGNLGAGAFSGAVPESVQSWIKNAKNVTSQKFTKFTTKVSHPWLSFMKWYLNNKAAASKVSNATAASTEALKEAVLMNEMRTYGANLSTVEGSYGTKLIEESLSATGIERGVTMSETLQNLSKAGVVLDPATFGLSEYEGWQADYVAAQNALTKWGDISGNVSQVVYELTNPDIEPVISQQLSEVNKANADLLKAEQQAGLLSKEEIKANKGLMKDDEGFLYAMHSQELSVYIVRNYELKVITNEAKIKGITDLESYTPYIEARGRLEKAAKALNSNIRRIADERYVPALKAAEYNLMNRMIDPKNGVFSRAFVEAMRNSGKFGENGTDWMKLVAKKDVPKGVYNPFSKTVKRDNTIDIARFKILEDDQITWPGNGLQELITEFGIARAEKDFVKTAKKATGLTTDVVVSGEETSAAGAMKEYRVDLNNAVNQGFKSFVEDVEGTTAIGKKRAIEQKEFYDEVATTGGVSTMDVDSLRAIMKDKGVKTTDTVVDQETLDELYNQSSPAAQKLITDTAGEKIFERTVNDYQETISANALNKRERIDDIDKELKSLEASSISYYAGLQYKQNKIPKDLKDEAREKAKKFRQEKIDLGKKAAKKMGFTGKTEEEFARFYKDKVAALKQEQESLRNEVSEVRGFARDEVTFDDNLYSNTSTKFIPDAKTRQEISDKYLGKFMSSEGGLADDWLNSGVLASKAQIREKIENTPELRNALLSTMYANSGSNLGYEEWLNTPIKLRRQQTIDSLRPEDAFLSFSMREDWQGVNSLAPRQDTIIGDLITLKIKPRDTLGEIPKGNEWEDATELEVLVPREAYATAMANHDVAKDISNKLNLEAEYAEIIKSSQLYNLQNLKETNPAEYETFLANVDRANALASKDVRESGEVKVAAEEYRKNIKDFEDSAIFTEKFSYLAELPAAKGTLKAFVEKNNLVLPDDKRPLKSKVKHALWEKVQNGEALPSIKGIKKSDISKDMEKEEFYKLLDETDLFKNADGANSLKYDIDAEKLYADIDDAIDGMMALIKSDPKANFAIESIAKYQGVSVTPTRFEFSVLAEILSREGQELFGDTITKLAHRIVDGMIPENQVIIKGNEKSLYDKVEKAIKDKLENRFATAKTQLESAGEPVANNTITELLDKYRTDIGLAESDELIIKTTDDAGEIQYEKVSPVIADIYNERPIYNPISTPQQILADLALLKKINTTDLSLRSFAKQAVSDPALAFATTGALPGTLQAMRSEIEAQFGTAMLNAMEATDPTRYTNIQLIAARKGITPEEALTRNVKAIESTQIPFTLLSQEMLRQANTSKYGNKAAISMTRRTIAQKINSGLRRTSDRFSYFQNRRETYARLLAGEKAYIEALRKGFSLEQAESFREHAINTATTNFRTKHTVFNTLRSTVPYLTSGISGAKSFWKMFELDPIGVSSRIFTGFILPIMYFAGEIFSDENLRKKYEALAESEKSNHIVIAVGGELILIPVGEELGQYTNIIMHIVEALHGANQYDFWNLMLNDLVGLIPGVDLTGFTDPEMWEPLSGETPNFLEVMENGIAKVLAGTMPPVVQSVYMANTGRDLYTGKQIDTGYITIDADGKATIMSYSTSQFAKALATLVGGDARVIEKVVSGTIGTVGLHVLDTLTSAVQYTATGGKEGSLTTGVEKAIESLSKPFTSVGYNTLDRRWNTAVSALYRKKEEIEKDDRYIAYNEKIAKTRDPEQRQKLINERNNLFNEYQKKVEALVKGYRDAGGSLDNSKFSTAVSLLVFEDAVRSDRQFMELNTNYQDAYKQAMQTLYDMGIKNPEGISSLGYVYTDKQTGKMVLKMWTPAQMQIIQNAFYEQGDIHAAHIKAIIDDRTENSLKKQRQAEAEAEQKYWDKYNATGKLSNAEWDAIDDLRKTYNTKVVLALQDYMNAYGAMNVLSSDAVMNYLVDDVIKVPSSEEKVKGRYVSSGGGVLNKQEGFGPYYIKKIFGVVK